MNLVDFPAALWGSSQPISRKLDGRRHFPPGRPSAPGTEVALPTPGGMKVHAGSRAASRHIPVSTEGLHSQDAVIALLSQRRTYGPDVDQVDRIDTHISSVFLAGSRTYKLKRAVRYPYVDFSTSELRRTVCAAEVKLNRRTAADLYLGVRPITRQAGGSLALDGTGTPIDWVVEMVRFDQDGLLDRLALRHTLDLALMPALAEAVAQLHGLAEWRFDKGGREGMPWVIDNTRDELLRHDHGTFVPSHRTALQARTVAMLDRHADLLDRRRLAGMVRWCHGDLHLGNVCLLNARPTLFDCIEFNADIACVDVMYDLAFLLMDLVHRGLRQHANLLFNHYVTRTRDLDGLVLLPLFLACRASIRAMTSATSADIHTESSGASSLRDAASEYLRPQRQGCLRVHGRECGPTSAHPLRSPPDPGAPRC